MLYSGKPFYFSEYVGVYLDMHYACFWVLLVILVARAYLKRRSRKAVLWLWVPLLMKTIIPLNGVRSSLSLIPSTAFIDPIDTNCSTSWGARFFTGFPAVDDFLQHTVCEGWLKDVRAISDSFYMTIAIIGCTVVIIVFFAILDEIRKYVLYRKILNESTNVYDNVYVTEAVDRPIVQGVLKPKLLIPYITGPGIEEPDLAFECAIRHERVYMQMNGQILRLVGKAVFLVHCLDPLFMMAYVMFLTDLEVACDEYATTEFSNKRRTQYIAMIPVYEKNKYIVKERQKGLADVKTCGWKQILFVLVFLVFMALCFLPDPV